MNESQERHSWRKNLYTTNTGYSDNYTDVSFLTNLKTNVNQRQVSLTEGILGAGSITQQLCMVFIFYVMYGVIQQGVLRAESVLLLSTAVSGCCYLYFLTNSTNDTKLVSNHSKIVFLFVILGYLMSPGLKTLTESISSDTIDATSIVMMLIHLIFFDYQVKSAISSRPLSLNAAIFASLCLASRVTTSFDAFVLLTVSAQCFVLFPTFSISVRKKLTMSRLIALVLVTFVAILFSTQQKMSILFVILVFFVNVVCPILFVHWQKHKMNIYGPWDEAIIEMKKSSL